ncbi:MAG TPA: hypothetical protein VNO81_05455, partial [Candidatus Nitrosotenuis sp.]|nr:hypothetical protein [Candidatus Nitrosotenuis sp.]
MIVCEYGPWREPEKPPFSVEELIAAAWEIMLRGHASFDEALRLLARRAPGVLAAHGLEDLLAQLIQRIEELKEKERRTWDYEGFMKRQKQDLDRLLGRLERDLGRRDLRKLADLARGQNLVPLYRLRWQGGGEAAGQALDDLLDRLSNLLPLEEFRRRERFHGQQRVDLEKARQLKEHFEALDRL